MSVAERPLARRARLPLEAPRRLLALLTRRRPPAAKRSDPQKPKRFQHSFKLDATFAAILILATGITEIAFNEYVGFFEHAERYVDDMRIARFTPAEPEHPDIVIAAINEETLKDFAYRSPVDHAFIANVLKRLDESGARLIALDVLFDQPTEVEKDELLRQTILNLKVPLIVTYADNVSGQMTDEQQKYLDDFLPARFRAFGNLATDAFDDTVRRVHPGHVTRDGTYINGFARAVAAKLEIETPAIEVPTVWRGRPAKRAAEQISEEPFAEYPAHNILKYEPDIATELFKDKIVLIGAEYTLVDRHRTPFKVAYEQDMPGIVIHAHAVAQYLDGKIVRNVGKLGQILVVALLAGIGMAFGALHLRMSYRIAASVSVIAALWIYGFMGFYWGLIVIPVVMPTASFGLAMWMTDAVTGRDARKQKEFIQGAFSRFVSPKVMHELIADPTKLSIGGERRMLTLMFTDIAGFTTLSETIESKKLAAVLNEYLNGVCQIILQFDGTVDKFIGDAVMAIFNAPNLQPDHEEQATRCAIAIDAFAETFRAAQNAVDIPMGVTRIGVHTGEATVGNFGADFKMEYTALGDTVNTASRLEGINKYFGTRVCISEATRSKCNGMVFRPLAFIRPKGKLTSLGIFEPLDETRAASDYVRRYNEAYAGLERGDPAAVKTLQALYAENPDDKTVALHLKNASSGLISTEIIMDEK
jgi:adenylate cyclase